MESDKSEKELNAMQHKELVAYALDLQNRQKGTRQVLDALRRSNRLAGYRRSLITCSSLADSAVVIS